MSQEEEEEEPASPMARVLQAPTFNLCVLLVMGFKTTIDVNLFKQELQRTLLKHTRFSSKLVMENRMRGKFSWKRTNVDIENHVFVPDLDPNNMESPDELVEDFMSKISKNPMNLTRPLWEFHILNVKTSQANSTVIFKTHHSMGDGVSLMSLLLACDNYQINPGPRCQMSNSPHKIFPSKRHDKLHVDHNGNIMVIIKRLLIIIQVWKASLIISNTLIGLVRGFATMMFMKDTKTTPIRGDDQRGIESSPKRFVHRIVDFDDVKLVKKAMNVSVNDVATGVAEAGLSRYLNMRYGQHCENNPELIINKTNYLPKHDLRLRSTVLFNLRSSPIIEDLGEIMEKEKDLKGKWGNIIGVALVPLTIALENDILAHVRRAKATMDQKKLSLEPHCSAYGVMLCVKLFGFKIAAALTSAIFRNTTLSLSNMVGPAMEISPFGHPLSYVAPTIFGVPQALAIHFQSYADKFIISIAADEKLIPNPHQLCDDMVKSFKDIKDAVIERGLAC